MRPTRELATGRLLAALIAARRAAVDHVRWARRHGQSSAVTAEAIGLDPSATWEEITQAYALHSRDMRELFNQMDHASDDRGGV